MYNIGIKQKICPKGSDYMAENIINTNKAEEKELKYQASHMMAQETEKNWDENGVGFELGEYLRGSPFGC